MQLNVILNRKTKQKLPLHGKYIKCRSCDEMYVIFSCPVSCLILVNTSFFSHTNMNSMQPSRVTDFGALAQSAGFRIEDLANLNTSMYSVLSQIC